MQRTPAVCVLIVATLLVSCPVRAMKPELVERAEKATAIVQSNVHWNANPLGCAFCISSSGTFITSARTAATIGATAQLVLSPGEASQRIITAKLVRRDTRTDIAVFQASAPEKFTALELGDSSQVYDTMQLAAFGFPVNAFFGHPNGDFPSVSVKILHVTALRKKEGVVDRIYMDEPVNREAAGGPVVDDAGRVVGLVYFDGTGGHPSMALPVSKVREALLSPEITLKTPTLSYDQRYQEQHVAFEIQPLTEPAPAYEAQLLIRAGTQEAKTLTAPVKNGTADFQLVATKPRGKAPLGVNARFYKGTIAGTIDDGSIRVADRLLNLSSVQEIRRSSGDDDSTVTLTTGEHLKGPLKGLEAAEIDLGQAKAKMDLSSAIVITIDDSEQPLQSIAYTITVKTDGAVVGESSGTIGFSGAPTEVSGQTLSTTGPHVDVAVSKSKPCATPDVRAHAVHTPLLGGQGGNPMELHSPLPHDVVGFHYEMSDWQNRPIIRKFEPIYDRLDATTGDSVVAKDGYVVGGLLVDSDDFTHAARVIFVKVDNGRLNPNDNYLSGWIGHPSSGELPKQLAGHGEHVLGVCGRKGLNMDAIGLILQPN